MRRILHLQQHTHTGKVLAHKHTSYRGLFIIVAMFGIVLTFIYQAVRADELVVMAKVSAAIPLQPATISNPQANSTVKAMPILISGTCEYVTPVSMVELYDKGEFIGSTSCSTDGTYNLAATLQQGSHGLIVRTVNITGDYGPDSTETTFSYQPVPVTDGSGSKPSEGTTETTPTVIPDQRDPVSDNSLLIRSEHTYILYGPAKDAEWSGYFEGGTLPYHVTIDWGDGRSSSYDVSTNDLQAYRHHYDEYVTHFMTITVTDSNNNSLRHQFAAVTPYIQPGSTTETSGSTSINWFTTERQLFAYVAYITAATLTMLGVLMLVHPYHPHVTAQPVKSGHSTTSRRRRG